MKVRGKYSVLKNKLKRKWLSIPIVASLIAVLLITLLPMFSTPETSTTGEGTLSLQTRIALAAQTEVFESSSEVVRYLGETVVTEESWGYRYVLENGDIVEVGNSTIVDFKAHVKTIRWNGVADFSLWLGDNTYIPTLIDNTISFDLNDSVSIKIYPVAPCERLPEGGIEYDFTLNNRPAQNRITFDIDWNGITWTKLLPLDEEYDQATCEEEWGIELAPFTITPTSIISDVTSEVLLTRPEYKVNSYIGEATTNWHSNSGDLDGGVTYSNISRSYLHIHRGQMTDNLGDTAWVEDIHLDEAKKEITFTLPKTWLKNATYPVHQVCGLDPAYEEDMDFWVTDYGSDITWEDYDIFTNHSVPKGAVAEIIMANQEAGNEALLGIRTDGSGGNTRRVSLHEAESGGVVTCRMFVVCHETTGLVETFADDVSDENIFYLVGYWENVSFTEVSSSPRYPTGTGAWEEVEVLNADAANRVCHFVLSNKIDNTASTIGVRETSSAVERKFLVHEPETGGYSNLDAITKADANYKIDVYTTHIADATITDMGYFGEELDFVELFSKYATSTIWQSQDVSSDLDQDGRVTDWLLAHHDIDTESILGVRDGDDTSTNRYILEHEAEDDGGATGEVTGFGMSAKSNATGIVKTYCGVVDDDFYLMGYFKPVAVGEADISNVPTSKAFGVVSNSTTYWSNGSEPSWPLVDGDAYFTVTNNGDTCSITIVATNFTGGVGWTLGTPAENTVRITAFKEGDGSGDGVTLTTSPQSFITALSTNIDWELKLEAPTSVTDSNLKTSTLTLAATLD